MSQKDRPKRQDIFVDAMQTAAESSINMYKVLVESVVQNNKLVSDTVTSLNRNSIKLTGLGVRDSNCCPPTTECPPQCISTINRRAMQGETIIVPFQIKNVTGEARVYQVGVRELLDADGNIAPTQPQLNKQQVQLQPGQKERVLLKLSLTNFQQSQYSTDIVVREKEYNQNICFTLKVVDHQAVTAEPFDENDFSKKWHSWQSHFYC